MLAHLELMHTPLAKMYNYEQGSSITTAGLRGETKFDTESIDYENRQTSNCI